MAMSPAGLWGSTPIQNGQLTREEIEKGEADSNYRLTLLEPKVRVAAAKTQRSALHPHFAPQ